MGRREHQMAATCTLHSLFLPFFRCCSHRIHNDVCFLHNREMKSYAGIQHPLQGLDLNLSYICEMRVTMLQC